MEPAAAVRGRSRRRLTHVAITFVAALSLAVAGIGVAWAQQDEPSTPAATSGVDETVGSDAVGSAIILDTTVSGGAASKEALYLVSLGYSVDVVTAATWASKTASDFAAYRLIVIGDPTCGSGSAFQAAADNVGTWVPVVNGSVIVIGTDPVFHYSQGGQVLIEKGLAFAGGQAGKTGFYFDLSCSPGAQGATILNAVSPGWTLGSAGCDDNIHVVATNPFLVGLTDASLSSWGCSVHEFTSVWPSDFIPIAIDTSAPPAYTASDGVQGTPYILGRGNLSASNIILEQVSGSALVGAMYPLTATVQEGGTALAGVTVTFTVISGPNAGTIVTAITGVDGVAGIAYGSLQNGTDVWQASYVSTATSTTQTSNVATVEWSGAAIVILPSFAG